MSPAPSRSPNWPTPCARRRRHAGSRACSRRTKSPDCWRRRSRTPRPAAYANGALLAVLYATGLRAADAVSLLMGDLDLVGGRLRRPAETGGWMPLGAALPVVRRYIEEARPQLVRDSDVRAVFVNQRGKPLSRQGLWLIVKHWADATGLGEKVSPTA